MLTPTFSGTDGPRSERVLIVDDVPDNLALLHDALDESGYTVFVATSGEAALARARQAQPDIVLLDAVMPGMDGFELARQLKATPATAGIPLIFMTGLTETEHLVAALEAGGADYVTKPIKPKEVLARMQVHLRAAAQAQGAVQTRRALDAFGYASVTVRLSDGRLMWQTPLARELLQRHFPAEPGGLLPAPVRAWLARQSIQAQEPMREPPRFQHEQGACRLSFALHPSGLENLDEGDECLLVMREHSDAALIEAMGLNFRLTAREAEVLYWVVKGKINRDIGDILGASPATVKKHLERVFAKLGVETRTSAAAMALNRLRQLHPQWEL
ncbi:response regulator [Roseateles sp.]|uniref:response regulator n=1 Tax=Roseateles sp. TaxID=1971397 RepID=UPI003D110CA4